MAFSTSSSAATLPVTMDRVENHLNVKKEVSSFLLDPKLETADIDLSNNHWPRIIIPSKFELYKKEKIWKIQKTTKENKNAKGK